MPVEVRWFPLFAALTALAGCAGATADDDDSATTADDDGPVGDPATIPLEGACDLDRRLGGFVVEAYAETSIVDGTVSDGVVPLSVLEQVMQAGDCQLMRRNNPFCDPPCDPDQTCDHDGECIPYPAPVDLGTVTLLGLEAPVSMDPIVPGYSYFDTDLPHPAFLPGELLELRTSGGALEPFTLHGVGVHLLAEPAQGWVVAEGQPLVVAWEPPAGDVRSTVALAVNIDQHGVSPVTARCEFDDAGTGEVPAAVIEALFAAGVSGYPNGSLNRHTVDSASVATGCVDLEVGSPVAVDVDVAGYIPCTDDDDCPDGMECNEAVGLCE
jgi:hypothetical protein